MILRWDLVWISAGSIRSTRLVQGLFSENWKSDDDSCFYSFWNLDICNQTSGHFQGALVATKQDIFIDFLMDLQLKTKYFWQELLIFSIWVCGDRTRSAKSWPPTNPYHVYKCKKKKWTNRNIYSVDWHILATNTSGWLHQLPIKNSFLTAKWSSLFNN